MLLSIHNLSCVQVALTLPPAFEFPNLLNSSNGQNFYRALGLTLLQYFRSLHSNYDRCESDFVCVSQACSRMELFVLMHLVQVDPVFLQLLAILVACLGIPTRPRTFPLEQRKTHPSTEIFLSV